MKTTAPNQPSRKTRDANVMMAKTVEDSIRDDLSTRLVEEIANLDESHEPRSSPEVMRLIDELANCMFPDGYH